MCSSVCIVSKEEVKLFSVVLSGRTRWPQTEIQEILYVCIKYKKNPLFFFTVSVTEHWNRLPSKAMESPPLETVNTQLDTALKTLYLTLL